MTRAQKGESAARTTDAFDDPAVTSPWELAFRFDPPEPVLTPAAAGTLLRILLRRAGQRPGEAVADAAGPLVKGELSMDDPGIRDLPQVTDQVKESPDEP